MYAPQHHVRLAGIALLCLFATGCSTVEWELGYDMAMRSAAARGRRVVVVFTTGTNADARELDWKVFGDPRVKEMMREFVAVRQDYFLNRPEAEKLGVSQVPTIVVVRPDGSIAGSQGGKFTPESLRLFLIKNRFN
jgi:hypothetical protein